MSNRRELMDPQLSRIASMMPVVDLSDVAKIRALNMATQMPVSASDRSVETRELVVPRQDGTEGVRVRVYRPAGLAPEAPAILYCHPGLFFGTLEMDHARCMRFAAEVDCLVVSVDYRLAPEYPFPAGLLDCRDVLRFLRTDAARLGIDPTRVALAGCSTGATLVAALSLWLRDHAEPLPVLQVLVCPALDDRLDSDSMREFSEPGPMEAGQVGSAYTWKHYLGASPGEVSPYAAPARAKELSGLPPALVVTAEYDCVRDEGIEYALRLVRSGVPCELHHFPGCFHAFDFVARTASVSRRCLDEQVSLLKKALAGRATAHRASAE